METNKEEQGGTLFHSTNMEELYFVLLSNKLNGFTPQEIDNEMVRGVSFTTDKDFVYKEKEVTIELDSSVMDKYKSRSINFFDTDFGKKRQKDFGINQNDEKEIFVITGKIDEETYIKPLSKYLLSIRINDDVLLPNDISKLVNSNFKTIKIYKKDKEVTSLYIDKKKRIVYDMDDLYTPDEFSDYDGENF